MTCDSCADRELHPDVVQFAEAIADQLGGRFGEVAAMLTAPSNARVVASDRVRFLSVFVRDDRPVELLPAALDRARFTLLAPADDVHLGGSSGLTATSLDRATITPATGPITLDTRGQVWAIADPGSPVTVFVIVEQWDER